MCRGLTVRDQFVIFKPLSYGFEETIGFDVKFCENLFRETEVLVLGILIWQGGCIPSPRFTASGYTKMRNRFSFLLKFIRRFPIPHRLSTNFLSLLDSVLADKCSLITGVLNSLQGW